MEPVVNITHISDDEHSYMTFSLVYAIIYPPVTLCTILANLATIYAFIKERHLREKASDLLILSLAGADMVIGMAVLPLNSPNFVLSFWPFGETICKVLSSLSIIGTEAGFMTMVAISYDRYLLISIPYPTYVKRQTQRKICVYICLCWLSGVLVSTLELTMWNYAKFISKIAATIDFKYQCLIPTRRVEALALAEFLLFILTPIISVVVFSVIFLVRLRRRLQERQRVTPSNFDQPETSIEQHNASACGSDTKGEYAGRGVNSSKSRYMKPAVTLTVLVAAMIICVVPYCLYILLLGFWCPMCYDRAKMYAFVFMIYVNSLVNPCLYAATQSKIRRFYRTKIRWQ
ncbi:D(1A) dopamine receptor-like [Amphiura filiformis]|uniref:D(1A) dopamine receptor-like n=1 Tax=Amphiura filiformis TaxID=82378 RepID=UPI003B216B00